MIRGCSLLLCVLACLSFISPTAFAEYDPTPDLQRAAAPLLEFASWCAKYKAKTPGLAALEDAKKITDVAAKSNDIATALEKADDVNAQDPAVLEKRRIANETAARVFDVLSLRKHEPAEDEKYADYQLQAMGISPSPARMAKLPALMESALKDENFDRLDRQYLLAWLGTDTVTKTSLKVDAKLIESGKMPALAEKIVTQALQKKRLLVAAAVLKSLAVSDPKGLKDDAYSASIDLLTKKIHRVQALGHPMVAYISFPKTWNPAAKTNILVCYAGAGKEHEGICGNYRSAVGELPYIVLSPVTLSNTNTVDENSHKSWYPAEAIKPLIGKTLTGNFKTRIDFDVPGTTALLKGLFEAVNMEKHIYITGVSGGGSPCYAMLINHPDIIAAGAPACANFYSLAAGPAKGAGVPVQQLFGEKDQYNKTINGGTGILQQGENAAAVLKKMGFTLPAKKIIPNAGHDPLVKSALAFFEEIRAQREKKPAPQ